MDSSNLPLLAVILIPTTVIGWLTYSLKDVGKRESYLPPGPPTAPLLGNLGIFPKEFAHYKFTEWAREHGEIYSLKVGPATAVVLSSAPAVRELMERRSATTSDRPPNHMVNVITDCKNLVLARYSDYWRSMRRGAHEILTIEACKQHLPIQQAEATQLMHDLLTRPKDFYTSVRRYSSSVIMSVLYGRRSPRFDTPETKAFFHVQHLWEHALEPGAHPPVDLLPILQKFPAFLAPWKKLCAEVRRLQRSLYFTLLSEVEKRTERGEANGCWMETVCARAEEWGLDRELVGYLGGSLIEGGSDTTSSYIQSLILALVANPEVQKKAHEEIDRVIGTERAPVLEDFESLPYCNAIVNEVHRWRPLAPLAIPHSNTHDETYKGYLIPKDTTIFVNFWGISHDPNVYEDPSAFNPDRFMESEFGTKPEARVDDKDRKNTLAFGSGRRICPGIHLATNSIRLNVMNLLWAFNFKKALDSKTGKEIEPDTWDFAKGILTCPNPFDCRIEPRSPHHAEIIEHNFQEATHVFEQFEHELCKEDKDFVDATRKH
ncbi:hypothetical protein FRB94_003267 [Tulasnella sp. JGI-2019a]|nr:hypothetical protein FRB93_003060 [Tulasnella sp. JGI-2019a]KAG9013197.1 hypothetical protein FRB94_003267 [Tulasnella sp. JGI-2019a]